jgi:hypothetical protein
MLAAYKAATFNQESVYKELAVKWENKAREFDKLGNIFRKNNTICIIGAKLENTILYENLAFLDVPIIFTPPPANALIAQNKAEFNRYIRQNKLNSPGKTVIINYKDRDYAKTILSLFLKTGKYFEDKNIFYAENFCEFPGGDFLSIYALYTSNKVYLKHNCCIITTFCNLNCKFCLNFTPYIKHPEHFSFEQLKNDIDIYFNCVDRVGLFQLGGGETLLYSCLLDLLMHICKNYRDRIGRLEIVTNTTIMPSDDLCLYLKENNISVICDDYSEAVPRLSKEYDAITRKLMQYGVTFYGSDKKRDFFEVFPPSRHNYMPLDEKTLSQKYDKCTKGSGWQLLRDGRLYSCNYSAFAIKAGLIKESENDYLDLVSFDGTAEFKKKLIEFRSGYNNLGYVEFCKFCNGSPNINPFRSLAGIQAQGKLNWNVTSPTFLEDNR